MNLLDASKVNVHIGSRTILADISISLQPGQIVTLLGPNGSGKTTLLSALIGFRQASGSVRWNDRPIETIDRATRAKLVALLPQTPTLPEMSVRDFVALGRTAALGWFGLESPSDAAVIDAVLTELDLTDFHDRPMHALSGGQRQRALIGRALAQQASALLLDEPDTFLDLRQQQALGQLLKRLSRQRNIGIVLASHDLNFAIGLADRFVLLKEGRLLGQGSIDQLRPELLSQAFDVALMDRTQIAPAAAE